MILAPFVVDSKQSKSEKCKQSSSSGSAIVCKQQQQPKIVAKQRVTRKKSVFGKYNKFQTNSEEENLQHNVARILACFFLPRPTLWINHCEASCVRNAVVVFVKTKIKDYLHIKLLITIQKHGG